MKKLSKKNLQDALYGIEAHYETWSGALQLLGIGLGFAGALILNILLLKIGGDVGRHIGGIFTLIMLVPIFYFPFQGALGAIKLIRWITKNKSKEIIDAGRKIENIKKDSKNGIKNIEDILSLSKETYSSLEKVIYIARFKKNQEIREYLSHLLKEVRDILLHLREDLSRNKAKKRSTT